MNIDYVTLCVAFFVIGILIAIIGVFVCRIQYTHKKRSHSFKKPIKFKPKFDLDYPQRQESIDKSSAQNTFSIK